MHVGLCHLQAKPYADKDSALWSFALAVAQYAVCWTIAAIMYWGSRRFDAPIRIDWVSALK